MLIGNLPIQQWIIWLLSLTYIYLLFSLILIYTSDRIVNTYSGGKQLYQLRVQCLVRLPLPLILQFPMNSKLTLSNTFPSTPPHPFQWDFFTYSWYDYFVCHIFIPSWELLISKMIFIETFIQEGSLFVLKSSMVFDKFIVSCICHYSIIKK